jgi:hypothetical protein
MTTAQAEVEITAHVGMRPIDVTNTESRRLVRLWLSSRGLPSDFVRALPYAELAAAYNDPDGDGFHGLQARHAARREADRREADEIEAEALGDEIEAAPAQAAPAPAPVAAGSLAQAIQSAIEEAAGGIKAGLDESSVRVLIDERIAEIGVLRHDVTVRTERGEIKAEIKGAHKTLPLLLKAMQSRQLNGRHPNIMLSGPTGSGKTHAVESCASALGLEFYSNGAISQDYQLVGFRDAAGNYHETPLRKAFGRPAVYLFDEFDSSDNSPMLCIAAVLANSGFHFPDEMVPRHDDSVIIAAGNTWGNGATADFVGRNKIDAAIRSRFPVRIAWDYDEKLEIAMSGNPTWASRIQKARALARKAGLKVIIDPRMTQAGAALIEAGFSDDEAAQLTYLADLTADQRAMVEG